MNIVPRVPGSGGGTAPITSATIDLSAPAAVVLNGYASPTITDQGGGFYKIDWVGINAITDGTQEMLTLAFQVKDPAGTASDVTSPNVVMFDMQSTLAGWLGASGQAVGVGVAGFSGSTYAAIGSLQAGEVGGFVDNGGTLSFLRAQATSNAAAVAIDGSVRMKVVHVPSQDAVGTATLGTFVYSAYQADGNQKYQTDASGSQTMSGSSIVTAVVCLGQDSAHTLPMSAVIRIDAIRAPLASVV